MDSGLAAVALPSAAAIAAIVVTVVLARRQRLLLTRRIEELQRGEAQVRRMFDELPGAVLVIDADSVVRSTNAAARQLFGPTDRDLRGRRLVDLVLPIAGRTQLGADLTTVAHPGYRDTDRDRDADGFEHADGSEHADSTAARVVAASDVDLLREAIRSAADGVAVDAVLIDFVDDQSMSFVAEVSIHRTDHGTAGTDHGTAGSAGSVRSDGSVSHAVGDLVVRLRDVSDREANRRALDQARVRFQNAFQSAPTGMALVRLDDGRIVDANESLAEMLRVPALKLIGCTLREFTHPDDVAAAQPHRARLELGIVDSYRLDQRYRRHDGSFVWARTRVSTAQDDGVMLAITHIEDVTDQLRSAERLRHAARHDELTGLPNRSYLMSLLHERLDVARINEVAVLFIDIDQFKTVNDSLGHVVGDELLAVVANRLHDTLGEGDLLARFGGDEFVVVSRRPPAELAEHLRVAMRGPITIGAHELFVTGSIGWSRNSHAQVTPHDLMRDADAAMYRAKARGRDCVEGFDIGGHLDGLLALRTVGELRRGIGRGEVVPYYQPIIDLPTGRVVGYEVLARWLHPDRGLLAPAEFLPFADEAGLSIELGTSILRDAVTQLGRWRESSPGFAQCTLSVNVGTRQLIDNDFLGIVRSLLAETGVPADALWIEITETALLSDVKSATVALRDLRSLGLHLAVDDFGTGYSSLTYLKRFPVEAIKIDRSFVAGLGLDADDTSIVSAVIQLGHALGLTVVAEGVESPLQLSQLREIGCDCVQGYLFSRPRPAHLIERERASV